MGLSAGCWAPRESKLWGKQRDESRVVPGSHYPDTAAAAELSCSFTPGDSSHTHTPKKLRKALGQGNHRGEGSAQRAAGATQSHSWPGRED